MVAGPAFRFFLFTINFTFRTHTHPYYHIQLYPIFGLSASAIIVNTMKSLLETIHSIGKFWWVPIIAVLLFMPYSIYRAVRNSLYQVHMERPSVAREIGELIRHSPHVVYVANYYGVPLCIMESLVAAVARPH